MVFLKRCRFLLLSLLLFHTLHAVAKADDKCALDKIKSAAVLRVVYPDGRVTAVGTLRRGNRLRQESWTQFAARLKPGEGFQESISDPAIEVDGDIAMVWAP